MAQPHKANVRLNKLRESLKKLKLIKSKEEKKEIKKKIFQEG